jgi:ABC-type sugar transport system ATPase subunit
VASLSLRNVSKRFDQQEVVRNVDIEVESGEFMVLVGPSGCGKSTTLRMIAGLETLTSGTIKIGSRIINNAHPADRDVAMVFQSYALYPHMSVYDNMAYGLKRRDMPKVEIDRRVNATAAMLRLDALLSRRPAQLSGGQRQRVALGRAIVREPAVFLMDEPLSNLDAKLRVEMRGELARLHAALRVTTIYVTHDQVEAMTMGDRIVVMNAGRVEQIGQPLDLYKRPATLFVARFLGLPEINILEGRIERKGSQNLFVSGHLTIPITADSPEPVSLGLRPQKLHGAPSAEAGNGHVALGEARVIAVEHHGPESYASCTLGEIPLTVAIGPASHLGIGDRVMISADLSEPHFFLTRTGLRL